MIPMLMMLGLAGPSTTNSRNVDVNGKLITVGARVKLVCVVTAIDPYDAVNGAIKVTALHINSRPIALDPATGRVLGDYAFEGSELVVE